ncbi:MAG: DUF4402 domain-containing protein [Desulfobacterales bacterium]|nr:DUF4402 domain-containing protein [Desulfobacterales bacterium]
MMRPKNKKSIALLWAALILLCPLCCRVFALTVDALQPLSFGTIIADPSQNETIEIDARFGPAGTVKTSAGVSVLSTPGSSGIIRVSSGLPFSCTLVLPAGANLTTGGNHIVVDHFSTLSMAGGSSAGGVLDLYIGGRLNIQRGQAGGSYSGSTVIMVVFE